MAAKAGFGGTAVEEDVGDGGMLRQKVTEIIHLQAVALDVGIETPRTDAGMQHIPHGDVRLLKRPHPPGVGGIGSETEQIGEYRPEGIARMRIVLAGGK